eukprot:TRINITY_DN7666_c0_g5_i3.p1 TRINITY_DN7666_c0_g5~~TRINITY_DN7666_c0_g5_i3.p1  ORF type:complete len:116 (+),score=36.07 TRINITY_DN7666_c0_g5_i3:63-410(+)
MAEILRDFDVKILEKKKNISSVRERIGEVESQMLLLKEEARKYEEEREKLKVGGDGEAGSPSKTLEVVEGELVLAKSNLFHLKEKSISLPFPFLFFFFFPPFFSPLFFSSLLSAF